MSLVHIYIPVMTRKLFSSISITAYYIPVYCMELTISETNQRTLLGVNHLHDGLSHPLVMFFIIY